MATPSRSAGVHGGSNTSETSASNVAQPEGLRVVPLNSTPYIDPSASHGYNGYSSSSVESSVDGSTSETSFGGVHLSGSAAKGKMGNIVGLMDIGESEDAYLFRVSLPGVARNEKDFSCVIECDGKVHIRGVTTTGEKTVCKMAQIFRMQTQNLCQPGPFSITFYLPGPIDNKQFTGCYGTDGILEGIVKKKK